MISNGKQGVQLALITHKLVEFPGFGVHYDPSQKPYFEANITEDLRKLASKPLGKELLEKIANAKPKNRTVASSLVKEMQAIPFFDGINVMCVPTTMDFTQAGFKRDIGIVNGKIEPVIKTSANPGHNPKDCHFYSVGGSFAEAANPACDSDKMGTVSIMHYTNAQTFSQGSGEREHTWPYIVLAHELIHSLHHVLGIRNNNGEEEEWTSGLGKFIDEPMSENKMRDAFGHPLRKAYK